MVEPLLGRDLAVVRETTELSLDLGQIGTPLRRICTGRLAVSR